MLVAQGNLPEALKAYRDGPGDPQTAWRRPTPATPAGSATCRCPTTGSATCWWRRAICRGAESLPRRPRDPRAAGEGRSRQRRWQRDLSVVLRQDRRRAGGAGQSAGGAESLPRRPGDHASAWRRADPGNADWQRDLSVSHDKIGDVLVAQGNLPGALAAYRDGLAIMRDGWPRPTRATPAGSATCRSATTRSATCWWRRATCRARWRPIGTSLAIRGASGRGATRPTPAGSATCRSATSKLGDVLLAQGNLPGALAAYRDGPRDQRSVWPRRDPANAELAARPVGQPRQDRRRAGGAGRPAGRAGGLSGRPGDPARRWRGATRATPSGSATCRSATTRSATCWWRRGMRGGAGGLSGQPGDQRNLGGARSGQHRVAARFDRILREDFR